MLRVVKHLFKTMPTLPPAPSPLAPVLGFYTFLPGLADSKFAALHPQNIFGCLYFSVANKLMFSRELETRFYTDLDFFRRA